MIIQLTPKEVQIAIMQYLERKGIALVAGNEDKAAESIKLVTNSSWGAELIRAEVNVVTNLDNVTNYRESFRK